jgi:DNA-binding LacI/PurR family transcriptional regulator
MAVVKMQDVARAAGVSLTTVSRVLGGGDVAALYDADTIERVRGAAAEMGYVPNALARRLRSGRSGQIGVVNATAQAHFQGPIGLALDGAFYVGLSNAAAELGITSVNVFPFAEPSAVLDRARYLDGSIDGLIIRCHEVSGAEVALIDLLTPSHLPLVAAVRQAVPDAVGFVDADQRGCGRLATQHLLELGHRRIAFGMLLAEHVSEAREGTPGSQPALRYAGYRETLREAGVTPRPEWLTDQVADLVALAQGPDRISAICTVTAELARRVAAELATAGLAVPADVSLIAVDDVANGDLAVEGLTTVHFPVQEIAEQSVRNLTAMVRGARAAECRTLVPVELVVRQSTARLPG